MDILFVTATEQLKLNSVSNGTMLLGSILLQAGFDVDILRFCQFKSYKVNYETFISDITTKIANYKPKCVSFYTLWPYYHVILRIAKELKKIDTEIITVLGGPHCSATAQETISSYEQIDFICTGEGENTVVPFFKSVIYDNKKNISDIPGLYYREGQSIMHNSNEIPLYDLNTLPHWDKRLLKGWNPSEEADIHNKNYFMPIDAGRGCPYSCTFCSTSNFWRRTYRLKSADTIINDIVFFKNNYGINSFWFSHDAFTSNMSLVSSVCEQITERKLDITWRCSTRIDCLSEDLLNKMIQAGLTRIEIGIESGSPRMQKLINKRLNLEYAKKMISTLIEHNLYIELFFMHGFPDETPEDLNQTLEFLFSCLDMGVAKADLNLCRFAPATQLTIENLNQIVLDPHNDQLSRNIFGYHEEYDEIIKHKEIFSTFYNLSNELRNKFQYLTYFERFYQKYKLVLKYLRKFYAGDNLSFYLDFYNSNKAIFSKHDEIVNVIRNNGAKLLQNYFTYHPKTFMRQMMGLLEFSDDIKRIEKSNEDITLTKTYNFCYLDYIENTPIEKFTDYQSELTLQKQHNLFSVQLNDIQPLT